LEKAGSVSRLKEYFYPDRIFRVKIQKFRKSLFLDKNPDPNFKEFFIKFRKNYANYCKFEQLAEGLNTVN